MDPITSVVIEGVAKLAADEVKLLGGTREKANRLASNLNTIQPYLHDAEVKAMTDPRVRGWLTRLKTILYEADDAIDEWNTKSRQGYFTSHHDTCWNAVSDFFTQCTCYRQLALRHNIGKKIEGINNELADIASKVNELKFLENTVMPGWGNEPLAPYDAILKARMTDSTKENVIGREGEIESLREMLVGKSYSEKSEIIVISVFGPPGYGKTSLAKHMFHEVGNHFMKQIWVYAPYVHDEVTIIKKMLDATKKDTGSVKDLEGLKNILVDEFLKNNRLLLVIDDIWEVDHEIWKKLCNTFSNFVTKGSRILVTTRDEKVAKKVCSAECKMHVKPLSTEISLSILRNNVILEGKDESEVSDLMKIGGKIVEKCGGVPLAITTMAGALRNKNTRDGWKEVLESEMWEWDSQSRGGILPALWLSYYHLSPQLKQCFRYCTVYPKGNTIVKEDVVPMWVAQGYVSEKSGREIEDIGGEYFDELVGRSLFQNAEWDEYGNIEQCRMHDLVYDLARFVTKGEVLVIEGTKNESISTELPPLHCIILDGDSIDKSHIDAVGGLKKLRTLMSTKEITFCSFIKKLQCLRVLEWEFDDKFPAPICNLVHLRYLSLTGHNINVLLNSIGQLRNLQYLHLCSSKIEKLPKSIKNLSNLRHLDLSSTGLSLFSSSIIKLSNLRHLSLKGNYISEIPEDVGSLTLLRSLDLSFTDLSLLPSSFTELSNLRHLTLGRSEICEIPEAIGSLKLLLSLHLEGTRISKLPESIANLSHLQELLLHSCGELSMLPKGICQLTGLKKLGNWGTNKLRELPEGIGRLTNLERLDKFVVVKKDHDGEGSSNVEELKQLNNLRGRLEIENLEDVGSEEEAASAHLELKTCLNIIRLSYNMPNQSTNSDVVLQALRPPFCLRELQIKGFPGSKLPTWLGSSLFSGLHELSLSDCIGCTTLPALGNLPELRRVDVSRMLMVRKLTSDVFGSMHGFPKLEFLSFAHLEEWEDWEPLVSRDVDDEIRIFNFPSLREFIISQCPKLRSLPPIFSASLQDVVIGGLMDLNILPSLPNLRSLSIISDDVVSELPNSLLKFSSLQTLQISSCKNLKSLPEEMVSLKQLQELKIDYCPLLEQSCEEGGEQWHKISHIPDIRVNSRNIRSSLN